MSKNLLDFQQMKYYQRIYSLESEIKSLCDFVGQSLQNVNNANYSIQMLIKNNSATQQSLQMLIGNTNGDEKLAKAIRLLECKIESNIKEIDDELKSALEIISQKKPGMLNKILDFGVNASAGVTGYYIYIHGFRLCELVGFIFDGVGVLKYDF